MSAQTSYKNYVNFSLKTIAAHTVTYFIAGAIAYPLLTKPFYIGPNPIFATFWRTEADPALWAHVTTWFIPAASRYALSQNLYRRARHRLARYLHVHAPRPRRPARHPAHHHRDGLEPGAPGCLDRGVHSDFLDHEAGRAACLRSRRGGQRVAPGQKGCG